MSLAIQQEIARSKESRYDHRLYRVLLVCRGLSCYKVGGLFGQHPTTIQRWVRRFEKNGFAGLVDGERPGRVPFPTTWFTNKDVGEKIRCHDFPEFP